MDHRRYFALHAVGEFVGLNHAFQCHVGTIGRQSFAIQRLQQVQLVPLLAGVSTAVVAERKGNILQGPGALVVAYTAIANSCAGTGSMKEGASIFLRVACGKIRCDGDKAG